MKLMTLMIHRLEKNNFFDSIINAKKNCLKCDIRIFAYGIERKVGVIL